MDESRITFKIEKQVAIVTWGPPPSNRIELYELATHLALISEQFGSENKAHVIVLSGKDDNSWDFGKILLEPPSEGDGSTSPDLPKIADALSGFNGPVIAAIKGDTIGLGLELALACDLRIVSETSNFGLPQIESGKIPWDGGTQRLTRTVGPTRAMEMILTGRMMDADEAERSGLVSRIVPLDELMDNAIETADTIAGMSRPITYLAKEAVNRAFETTLAEGVRFERRVFHSIFASDDQKEGMSAFIEKRQPNFNNS